MTQVIKFSKNYTRLHLQLKKIKEALKEANEPISETELAKRTKIGYYVLKNRLQYLLEEKQVDRKSKGMFVYWSLRI